jgi:hypothetical protein
MEEMLNFIGNIRGIIVEFKSREEDNQIITAKISVAAL